jgi:hypothetical protein
MTEFRDWDSPPDAVWVWGKYKKYDEVYCHSEEIKQHEFEIPVTKYVRDDLAKAALDLLLALKDTKEELLDVLPNMRGEEFNLRFGIIDAAIAKALGKS